MADQELEPSMSQLEIVTLPEADSPRTMCWRAIRWVLDKVSTDQQIVGISEEA